MANYTTSFLAVDLTYSSPLSGQFNLGAGAGNAEEGIVIEPVMPRAETTWGADGGFIHAIKAARGAKITLSYLQNGSVLVRLNNVLLAELASPTLAGNGVITLRDRANGLNLSMLGVVFSEEPTTTYNNGATILQYVLMAGKISTIY